MVTKTDKATIKEAYGFSASKQPKDAPEDSNLKPEAREIVFPIDYEYSYDVYATSEEATNAGYNFLALANAAEKNAGKAKEYQKQISLFKPDPNSDAEVRKALIKNLMSLKKISEAQATALVDSM